MPAARAFIDAEHAHPNGHLLLRAWRGGWWQWQRSHWHEIEERAVREAAYRFTEDAVYLTGKGFAPWAPTRNKVADLLDAAKAVTYCAATSTSPSGPRT